MDEQNRSDHATNVTETDGNVTAMSDIVERLRGWILVPSRHDHMGRVTEFHEVKDVRIFHEAADEIERLRAAGDAILSAFMHLTISGESVTLMKAREAFDAWEKARLGTAGDSTQHLATCVGFPTEDRRG